MTELELLAPAKSLDFGKSAINCGADAVYIGAPKFGARSAASNSLETIGQLIQYAHKFRSKVYVVLNTILFDHELDEVQQTIHSLWNLEADAIIIQDMGILEMDLPPIPIFASTQTHNISVEKIAFLEKNGIQRVILARELSITEIAEIRKHTSVELESFIHGAICVCYSGQCYLSHAITGKSGNRGECQQPCRWEYNLKNSDKKTLLHSKHLLSPKDLNLSAHLKELIDAGVTSFKIEGRLKDISYLKNITSWYRQQLDSIMNPQEYRKSSAGKIYFPFQASTEKTFNRGYTDYFINGKTQKVASFDTPKSLGTAVAEVLAVGEKKITVKNFLPLHNGDGLCFYDKFSALKGFRVNRVETAFLYPNEIPEIQVGATLYRNHDQEFESFLEKNECTRKIQVDLILRKIGTSIEITATDEDSISSVNNCECDFQLAKNKEKAEELIFHSLSKTGQSIFEIRSIDNQLEESYFFTLSFLNGLRRNVLESLESKRIDRYTRKTASERTLFPWFEKSINFQANVNNAKAREFYKKRGVLNIEPGLESTNENSNKALMTTRYCLKFETGNCPKFQSGNQKEWQKPLFLESKNKHFKLEFDCSRCEMKISL